ncbi:unnamed protein product [Coffea canephora]|uniref:WEB family protein At3g51220 n=2 Tax=Coffea TaxID=13442 RepID=A0A068TNL6_COFCA|nr:WEB family protein At3g51220 [Coffea arabica]CDO97597.1 unnamed protein product [Coffea canephora]
MEIQTSLHDHDEKPISPPAASDYGSKVDTSRPFRSVKEAVAIFGERFLAGEIYAPKAFSFPKQETPCFYTPSPSPKKSQEFESWKSVDSNDPNLAEFLKKLEAELEETKMELKVLKEKESETEVALASLNAELHKNMSRLAQAEAAAAAKATMASRSAIPDRKRDDDQRDGLTVTEEERRKDLLVRLETSPTLAQMLDTAAEKEGLFGGRYKEKKTIKKKPIIPLVGDLFSRKKGSSTSMINPLYASSHVNLN